MSRSGLVRNIASQNSQPPKRIEARAVARMRNVSLRTEEAYRN